MYRLYIGFRKIGEFGSIMEAKRYASDSLLSGMFSLTGEDYHDGWYQPSKWIVMQSGAEYSTNYNYFAKHQLMVTVGRTGTKFISRLDGTVFLTSPKRNLHDTTLQQLSRLVHISLCKLRYGGRITD